MGSAQDKTKVEKKSTKKLFHDLKNKLYGTFQKKKCDKSEEHVPKPEDFKSNVNEPPKPTSILTFLADHERAKLEEALKAESIHSQIDAEERKNFTYTTVTKEKKTITSSNDSGFTEKSDDSVDSAGKESEDAQGLNEADLVETFKSLKCDDGQNERKNSWKSDVDSAGSEDTQGLNEADLVETFKGLKCDDEQSERKKKKCQVYIARGKETQKAFKPTPPAPYQTYSNRHILSGGYVTVNPIENAVCDINQAENPPTYSGIKQAEYTPTYSDIDQALSDLERTVLYHANSSQDVINSNFEIAQEWVNQYFHPASDDYNADLADIDKIINDQVFPEGVGANPIEDFNLTEDSGYSNYDASLVYTMLEKFGVNADHSAGSNHRAQQLENFLTPPRSNENFFDPDSPANAPINYRTIYSANSPLSPGLLSPSNEHFQEIPVASVKSSMSPCLLSPSNEPFQEVPVAPINNRTIYSTNSPTSPCILSPSNEQFQEISLPDLPESVLESEQNASPTKERTKSSSSLNLKQFKDIQNQLVSEFAKEDCCKEDVGPAREAFREMFMGLDAKVRQGLCMRVAELPLETCYGVLHHVLMDLSRKCEREALLYSIFGLICERVSIERPGLLLEDFGLNLLKAATLRCAARPALTRYLVQAIRLALDSSAGLTLRQAAAVFTETDQLGDTLVCALARRGDACAAALAEVVRPRSGQPPLFLVEHCNNAGMTALHLACARAADARALRTVHVLLAHARADIWRGDIKGGDMALHYAVKRGNCDLDLVMILFKHVDRSKWKTLAHAPNRGQVSPIETARAAVKVAPSDYPEEVLNFLKKCR